MLCQECGAQQCNAGMCLPGGPIGQPDAGADGGGSHGGSEDGGRTDSGVPDAGPLCVGGLVACREGCRDLTGDPKNCGACDRTCGAGNACQGGACKPLPADCRSTPCPGDFYCDLSNGQCKQGCATNDQCPQPGTCEVATHTCECAPGTHRCGNACVPDSSTTQCGATCQACQAPENATASCQAGSCTFTCNPGHHRCGNACVPDDSPSSCGSSCTPCPPVPNGSAACNDGRCGIAACNIGHHLCSGQCVSDQSPASCGSSCSPCPSDPNGQATCDGKSCGISCRAGYHLCGGTCVSNSSPLTCGSACSPCPSDPNGAAGCNGTSCILHCATGYRDCGGACRTCPGGAAVTGTACSGNACVAAACASGYHLCGDQCVSDSNTNSCGSRCSACPTDPNGSATCDGTSCGLRCNYGYRLCGGSCRACPMSNATQFDCSGSSCLATACAAGYHLCNGRCVSNTSASSCGSSCTPCPTPANATATCTAGQCGYTCNPGSLNCSGTCKLQGAYACGASCQVCPAPPTADAEATCEQGTCRWQCKWGFRRCATGCCAWTLESIGIGGTPTLAIDPAGDVHVASIRQLGSNSSPSFEVQYLRRTAGTWGYSERVGSSPGEIDLSAHQVMLEPSGAPSVLVASRNGTTFRVLLYTRVSGWTDSTPWTDSCNGCSARVVAQMDGMGRIHAAFYSSPSVRYLLRDTGGWISETAIGSSVSGLRLALSGNTARIAGSNGSSSFYASRANGTWSTESGFPSTTGVLTSLAVDGAGEPHAVFRSPASTLVYAYRSGGVWTTESTGVRADGAKLLLDTSGTPILCSSYGGQVHYSTRVGGVWFSSEVRSGTTVDCVLDGAGNPHLALSAGLSTSTYAR